jgi:Predicted membrane protein
MPERADTKPQQRSSDPGEPDEDIEPIKSVAVGAALLTGFGIAAVLLALGVEFWWIGFPMIGGLVPLAVALAGWYESDEKFNNDMIDETENALHRLRERYANGELTDAEFERRLERLVATESVDDAKRTVERRRQSKATDTAVNREVTREPETER